MPDDWFPISICFKMKSRKNVRTRAKAVASVAAISALLTSGLFGSPENASLGHGFEGQRKADLGNGTYLNPILSGDRPDPSILKVGKDFEDDALVVKAFGSSLKDCSPLTMICGDQSYEMEVVIEVDQGSTAGLLLFYSPKLFAGLGFSADTLVEYSRGEISKLPEPESLSRHLSIRLRNSHHMVTIWYSRDREHRTKHGNQYDVSGYQHNTAGRFLNLRPTLFVSRLGEVRFKKLRYTTTF